MCVCLGVCQNYELISNNNGGLDLVWDYPNKHEKDNEVGWKMLTFGNVFQCFFVLWTRKSKTKQSKIIRLAKEQMEFEERVEKSTKLAPLCVCASVKLN